MSKKSSAMRYATIITLVCSNILVQSFKIQLGQSCWALNHLAHPLCRLNRGVGACCFVSAGNQFADDPPNTPRHNKKLALAVSKQTQ